jgi:hypothetical protein
MEGGLAALHANQTWTYVYVDAVACHLFFNTSEVGHMNIEYRQRSHRHPSQGKYMMYDIDINRSVQLQPLATPTPYCCMTENGRVID